MASLVKIAFTKNDIVPDVVDHPPTHVASVKYSKGDVNLGNELAPVDVRKQPEISYPADEKKYYTLIMTDPDAPSRANPTRREFRHWLVVNIPGSDVSKGEVISAYVGSGPPKDTGLHRYIFLVYEQPGKLSFDEKFTSDREVGTRPLFSSRKFAEKYKLELNAGNYYQAQYDDSVPDLHKQLGLGQPTPAKV
ncbi:protein D3-like isoform X2 [Sitophilus oryzae]|uniref:Protein D3-like isoform X2 n=1 Tax=Sitophilus oryzae TaxID=7048 RepID=A0A6J2XMB1_SITOR|nr:protein D3-like isoform X2 [Sitophilus oryzae]